MDDKNNNIDLNQAANTSNKILFSDGNKQLVILPHPNRFAIEKYQ